ncbi:MbtH family NRPS accessory protein [uncultured Streptomyces sp.]|uniref:MbtH family protein n=1 Tax=uncultured Streptomyces sp. TaxID=174707 RepID=UPI0026119E50|nr:MbtH family NRPS accessory protein [uncultured Streptomyces sp.]
MTQRTEETYSVVVNDEEQYSIWPVPRPIPAGWKAVPLDGTGTGTGTKEKCLEHIERVWQDMRPRGLRESAEGTR